MRIDYLLNCPEHLATVAEWRHTEFGDLEPEVTLAQRFEKLRATLNKDSIPLTVVALSDDGRPMGAASLFAKTITHAHLTPWLSAVVVPPDCRGQGIASALSLRIADEAARLGFARLHLFTRRDGSLYSRLGWTTIDVSSHAGTAITIMVREAHT